MRVFILCTGRTGSTTIVRACEHCTNYTASHESLSRTFGAARFDYPDQHIEADNRLSWHLGQLNRLYGQEAFYVHMRRDRDKVARSFLDRFHQPGSIMDAYCNGIHMVPSEELDEAQKLEACYEYIDTVNSNIELFLTDKPHQMTLHLERAVEDFPLLWKRIGAEGDLNKAMQEFTVKHNPTSRRRLRLGYRYRLLAIREWRHFSMFLKSLSGR